MRRAMLLLLLMLAGCQKDFDDQYADTEQRLKNDAERLDKQMEEEAQKEAGEAR